MTKVPNSTSLRQKTYNLPVGIFVRPLAPTNTVVPDVSYGSTGKVVRCHRCRTYINPFVKWESGGRRWTCNICSFPNDTPAAYQASLDENGRRVDFAERPELCHGSVEFIAPGDYMVRPPQPPAYLFVIDVTYNSVASGLVLTACQAISQTLSVLPGGERTLVGVLTFDATVHFYKLDGPGSQLMVVPSLSDMFVPLPDGALVNLSDNRDTILKLLDQLPGMWANQRIMDSCAGSAVKAAGAAMKQYGGKMSVFLSSPPTTGDLLPVPRDAKTAAPQPEHEAAKPIDTRYRELAASLTQAQISVDLYIAGPTSTPEPDLPTISQLSQYSAGEVRYYPQFVASGSGKQLTQELQRALTRPTGWEAVMRLRVCRGWTITRWHGHFLFRHNDLLVIPNCHADQTVAVTLDLADKVVNSPYLYLQAALLYTNSSGERRIRVHTVCLPVTQNAADLLSSVDESAMLALQVHQTIDLAQRTTIVEARQYLQSQLQQHARLSILGPGLLGLLKSPAIREGRDIPINVRIALWRRLATLPADYLAAYCLPRLFCVSHLNPDEGLEDPATGRVTLPQELPLVTTSLDQSAAYVMTDGVILQMWVGRAIDPNWVRSTFGVDSLDHVHPLYADMALDNNRVSSILEALRNETMPRMSLILIRQGSPLEGAFFARFMSERDVSMLRPGRW